jgi:prevent-host-death family protein
MQKVTLSEAQKHLPELVRELVREREVLITEADRPVARMLPLDPQPSLHNLEPKSVGAILQPYPSSKDDILGEMLGARP